MRPSVSLRIARLLLVAAGALVAGTALFIGAASSDRATAAPWLVLLVLDAAGFVGAAVLLARAPRRAQLLAVGSALAMGALGTITGFGAGVLSFPAAGIGALAAWAALLCPPRRRIVVAFLVYLAIGVAVTAPTMGAALLYPVSLPFILIWPARFLLLPGSSIVELYVLLGIGVSVALVAAVRRPAFAARLGGRSWIVAAAVAALAGALAAAAFGVLAFARPTTSARFELDPLVLGVVFLGGALAAGGGLTLRLRPSALSAVALGVGATALFMIFTYRPAVTCTPNGVGQGLPLSWALRSGFSFGGGQSTSGGSSGGTIGGPGAGSSGEFRSGDRLLRFRCEGDQLVEFQVIQ
jgi:hypothetical protein